jgi:hypothetical protein
MDELTENLQKLNMIKAKFEQNKDMSSKSPTYSKPGTKKAPSEKCCANNEDIFLNILNFLSSCSTKTAQGECHVHARPCHILTFFLSVSFSLYF